MFTKKELTWMIIMIIIFEFILALRTNDAKTTIILDPNNPVKFLAPILIIFISVAVKKIAARHFNLKIEHSLFKFQRWGWYERSTLKRPFPMGLVLPFFLTFFSLGFIKPMTFLQFDAENLYNQRLLRKYGDYSARRTQINETDLAFTAAWGFYSVMLISVIAIIASIFVNMIDLRIFVLYPVFFNLWNLIPWENLDGQKLFFGSFTNWTVILILNLFIMSIGFALV